MNRRLLFISKFPDIINEFMDAMREQEIEIDTAQTGVDAALLLKKKEYQVVVTGISLDGYNGEQIITYINNNLPNTVCIIYTTTISIAQLQFFLNNRDVFRIFLRPVNFHVEFLQTLEEAFEYYEIQVTNQAEANERKQELEKFEKEIDLLRDKLQTQKQERSEMAKYMKRLMSHSVKTYTDKMSPEAKKKLKDLECDVVDMCCGQEDQIRMNLPKAEQAVQKIFEMSESV